jgi:WhiB family redox-sensing transcriptional regulator
MMAGSESEVPVKVMVAAASAVRNWVEDWTIAAACRGMDPDELFVQGAAQNRAKTVCAACPVRTECLADALDNRVEFGVWGGMTERERRALLRRRPDVRSWRKVLEGKREAYLSRQRATVFTAGG